MAKINKHLKTGLTLAFIGGISAIIISTTYLLTNPIIARNRVNKETKALKAIFNDENIVFSKAKTDFVYSSQYLINYYVATKNEQDVGYIYQTSGKNQYGQITLMMGINDLGLLKMVVIENTQSYASTLTDNYIDPINAGEKDYLDTTCGATYGAKLIKNMVEAANKDYLGRK